MSEHVVVSVEGKEVKATTSMKILTEELGFDLAKLRAGIIDKDTAMAISSLAGKMISANQTQIVYNKVHGKKDKISFMES